MEAYPGRAVRRRAQCGVNKVGLGGHTCQRVERPFAMPGPASFADPGAILVMAVRAAGAQLARELSPWVERRGQGEVGLRAGEGCCLRRLPPPAESAVQVGLLLWSCFHFPPRSMAPALEFGSHACASASLQDLSSSRRLHSGAVHEGNGIGLRLLQHYYYYYYFFQMQASLMV